MNAAQTAPGDQPAAQSNPNLLNTGPSKHRELLHAVNESALAVRNGWVTFVAMMAFFFVAVAGVTHKDLLLDSPVPLPIVQVKIELTRFFQFAPLILVLTHFSVLLQYAMMARKTRALHEILLQEEKKLGLVGTHPLRLELSSYFFVQAMAGPTRSILLGGFLRTMSWLTLGLFPLALLLYFQTTYLPFHDPVVTWAHRVYLVADFFILLSIGIFTRYPERGFWFGLLSNIRYHFFNVLLTLGVWLAAIFFSFAVATLPDGLLDKAMKQAGTLRVPQGLSDQRWKDHGERSAFWLTALLFEGRVDRIKGKVTSWFSRNLVVTDQDLVKDKDFALESGEVSLHLRGRDLRHASFDRSDLHGADLTGANLQNASLVASNLVRIKLESANMQGAVLRGARLQWADMREAALQNAILDEAQLQNADLRRARMQSASLAKAQMQGTNLRRAIMRKAKLQEAQLQGADLRNTQLQMAILSQAQLQGADLRRVKMQGAILSKAQMQGAVFNDAQMQGAYLLGAQLQGAFLLRAQLQGAVLRNAQLQGAVLFQAQLQGAILRNTQLQGAKMTGANLQSAVLNKAVIWQTQPPDTKAPRLIDTGDILFKPFTQNIEAKNRLNAALNKIPYSQRQSMARNRLAPILNYDQTQSWLGTPDHLVWQKWQSETRSNSGAKFRAELADELGQMACDDMTPNAWLAEAIVDRASMRFNGNTARLFERMVGADCGAVHKLAQSLLDRLKSKADRYKKLFPAWDAE